jgi:hypothetical protein
MIPVRGTTVNLPFKIMFKKVLSGLELLSSGLHPITIPSEISQASFMATDTHTDSVLFKN